MKISVLMLTYNAPKYVLKSIRGVHKTKKTHKSRARCSRQ